MHICWFYRSIVLHSCTHLSICVCIWGWEDSLSSLCVNVCMYMCWKVGSDPPFTIKCMCICVCVCTVVIWTDTNHYVYVWGAGSDRDLKLSNVNLCFQVYCSTCFKEHLHNTIIPLFTGIIECKESILYVCLCA